MAYPPIALICKTLPYLNKVAWRPLQHVEKPSTAVIKNICSVRHNVIVFNQKLNQISNGKVLLIINYKSYF